MKFRVLVLFSLILLASCGGKPEPLETIFPDSLGGLQRTGLVLGQEALDKVNKLHNKSIACEEAAIATYESDGGSWAMIWVSRHDNAAEAREQAAIMLQKMLHPLEGDSPFYDPENFRYRGVDVYRFQGMGRTHDVFSKGDLVFWISTTSDVTQPVLDAFLPE